MSHVGLPGASNSVQPPCARVDKNKTCTCAFKLCTDCSKTTTETLSGHQVVDSPKALSSVTVNQAFSLCHYCGFTRDHRRSLCVSCGRPNWTCSQCGDTVRKSPKAFRWFGIGGVVSIFVCSTCEFSFGPAFERFWSNFFKEVNHEVR